MKLFGVFLPILPSYITNWLTVKKVNILLGNLESIWEGMQFQVIDPSDWNKDALPSCYKTERNMNAPKMHTKHCTRSMQTI